MISNNLRHYCCAFKRADDHEFRKGGRFRASDTSSTLGQVLDLSSCGALILKKRFRKVPAKDAFPLAIQHGSMRLAVQARIVRQAKRRGGGQLLGLAFVDLTDQQRDQLKEIIRVSRSWDTIDLEGVSTDAA